MAKKVKHEEHENHERWLVSYADFITLLFAFFVVMYSMSIVDHKKAAQAAKSINWALHFSGTGGVGQMPIFEGPPSEGGCVASTGTTYWTQPQALRAMENLRKRLEKRLKPHLVDQKMSQAVLIDVRNGRLTVRMAASRFFDPAQAALRPEALPVVDAIGAELKELGRPVRIEAHTDDSALTSSRYRSNWDLSSARASTVVALLESGHGIAPSLLSAAGMSSARPLWPNDSAEHREANRRVEMVVDLLPGDVADRFAH